MLDSEHQFGKFSTSDLKVWKVRGMLKVAYRHHWQRNRISWNMRKFANLRFSMQYNKIFHAILVSFILDQILFHIVHIHCSPSSEDSQLFLLYLAVYYCITFVSNGNIIILWPILLSCDFVRFNQPTKWRDKCCCCCFYFKWFSN